jgi:hypothetical protein
MKHEAVCLVRDRVQVQPRHAHQNLYLRQRNVL